jgi:hypothetical protein
MKMYRFLQTFSFLFIVCLFTIVHGSQTEFTVQPSEDNIQEELQTVKIDPGSLSSANTEDASQEQLPPVSEFFRIDEKTKPESIFSTMKSLVSQENERSDRKSLLSTIEAILKSDEIFRNRSNKGSNKKMTKARDSRMVLGSQYEEAVKIAREERVSFDAEEIRQLQDGSFEKKVSVSKNYKIGKGRLVWANKNLLAQKIDKNEPGAAEKLLLEINSTYKNRKDKIGAFIDDLIAEENFLLATKKILLEIKEESNSPGREKILNETVETLATVEMQLRTLRSFSKFLLSIAQQEIKFA